jgi:dihydroxyacid dehydratase/phosphogluconate dehydratase
MKMHSGKSKDPLITRAEPVTLVTPLVEETLRAAGIPPNRERIIELFMAEQPRIAVVHGGVDHPPNIGMTDAIRRLVRCIWASHALPFEVSQSIGCEQLAHGTEGAHYALLSRNFCAANLAVHTEALGYDAAILVGVCDKMMVGNLRALIETDLARQRRRGRPVFGMILPSIIGREAFTPDEERRRFETLRSRMPEDERGELDGLLAQPLTPDVYAGMKEILDRSFHRRYIQERERDELLRQVARCTAVPGANCAASPASIAHRMIFASFGLVPRRLEITSRTLSDELLLEPVKRLVAGIQKRERRVSVSNLVRSNLGNAASVWSATGGHPSWILHLPYLADALGKKITVADIAKRARSVPQILAIADTAGKSAYRMAVEAENGGSSGIDTIMRTLSEKRLVEDHAPTLDGPWMERIMEARSANGNFLHSTTTPFLAFCGMSVVRGNVCDGGIARLGRRTRDRLAAFDKKVYLASFYLGLRDLQTDLTGPPEKIMENLKRKVTREDLYHTWRMNWPASNGAGLELANRTKSQLWDYLAAEKQLRIIIVVAGAGPHGAGMPELQLPDATSNLLAATGVLVSDGRISCSYPGISIAHVVPEALDGGGLASVRTGDWIFLDLSKGELHVVNPSARRDSYKILAAKDLLNRTDHKKRIHELERMRAELLPSFRILLDQVTSADAGVSPVSKR